MIKTFLGGVQLPVNPLDEIAFSYAANNENFEIVAIGEVTKIGSRGLIKSDVKSLFTDGDYPFVIASRMTADQYVAQVQRMFDARKPQRYIVTGDGVDINLLCSLESFKYSKPFGEVDDYYYTLSLKEYRPYSAKRIVVKPAATKKLASKAPVRAENNPAPKSHAVLAGDTLWAMAKRYYGDGSQYKKIWEANKSICANPNLIYPGQTFVIP